VHCAGWDSALLPVYADRRSVVLNYTRHYERLIERARNRTLVGYSEKHHVKPRCMGGGDEPENLVRLTPEEHFVAHQLLVRMHPGHSGLVWAVYSLTGRTKNHVRNNRRYGWLRRRFVAMVSEINRGRVVSAETRAKMSAARAGRKFGPRSLVTREKMSAASRGKPKSQAHREALSRAKLGKKLRPHSAETKEKIRASNIRAALTRDKSFNLDPAYRQRQRENMLRIWAERRSQKEG
jgi:Salmonella phage homing endonuclease